LLFFVARFFIYSLNNFCVNKVGMHSNDVRMSHRFHNLSFTHHTKTLLLSHVRLIST
jgi:hypothetical protein